MCWLIQGRGAPARGEADQENPAERQENQYQGELSGGRLVAIARSLAMEPDVISSTGSGTRPEVKEGPPRQELAEE